MSRTARLPLIVGTLVLLAALVTLIVRVQGDDSGVGAAGDDGDEVTAEDPVDADEPETDGPLDDDPTADDPTEDDPTEEPLGDDATGDGADDTSALDTPGDAPRSDDGEGEDDLRAAEGTTDGAEPGGAPSTADDRDDAAERRAGPGTAERGEATDDDVLAAPAPDPEASRDRVPGVDPLPDTGATPAALSLLALGGLAALRRR